MYVPPLAVFGIPLLHSGCSSSGTGKEASAGHAANSGEGKIKIPFRPDRDGNVEFYVMNADGTEVTRLTDDGAGDVTPSYSILQNKK